MLTGCVLCAVELEGRRIVNGQMGYLCSLKLNSVTNDWILSTAPTYPFREKCL